MSIVENAVPIDSIVPILFEPDLNSQLVSKIRYERFQMNETEQKYVQLLGPDVSFASHPVVTYLITAKFIDEQNKAGNPLSVKDSTQFRQNV